MTGPIRSDRPLASPTATPPGANSQDGAASLASRWVEIRGGPAGIGPGAEALARLRTSVREAATRLGVPMKPQVRDAIDALSGFGERIEGAGPQWQALVDVGCAAKAFRDGCRDVCAPEQQRTLRSFEKALEKAGISVFERVLAMCTARELHGMASHLSTLVTASHVADRRQLHESQTCLRTLAWMRDPSAFEPRARPFAQGDVTYADSFEAPARVDAPGFAGTLDRAACRKLSTDAFCAVYRKAELARNTWHCDELLYWRYNENRGSAVASRNVELRDALQAATCEEHRLAAFSKRDAQGIVQRRIAAELAADWDARNEKSPSYAAGWGIPEDELMGCAHGGGFRYLYEFLAGENDGYRLEISGYGLQVHPRIEGGSPEAELRYREINYAQKAERFFDLPAVLSFTIPAGSIDCASLRYEAALRSENRDKMSDLRLAILETGQVLSGEDVPRLVAACARMIRTERERT